jgi:hypothetical protein
MISAALTKKYCFQILLALSFFKMNWIQEGSGVGFQRLGIKVNPR